LDWVETRYRSYLPTVDRSYSLASLFALTTLAAILCTTAMDSYHLALFTIHLAPVTVSFVCFRRWIVFSVAVSLLLISGAIIRGDMNSAFVDQHPLLVISPVACGIILPIVDLGLRRRCPNGGGASKT